MASRFSMQQGDLFSDTPLGDESTTQKKSRDGDLPPSRTSTLQLDKLLLAIFFLLVTHVIVFTFGVDRGGRKARDTERYEKELARVKVENIRLKKELGTLSKVLQGMENASESEEEGKPTPTAELEEKRTFAGRYTIQLVTYTQLPRAEKQVDVLKRIGYDAYIISNGPFHQVCIERLTTRNMAHELRSRIQNETGQYSDAYIRTLGATG